MTRLVRLFPLVWFGVSALLACDPIVVVGAASGAGAAGGAAPTAAGAGGDGVAITVPWTATHEGGDLEEWTGDGAGWIFTDQGSLEVSTDYAHGGVNSVSLGVTPNGLNEAQATLGRDVTLESGRYGAWYLFPSAADARDAVIMKLATWGDPRVERFDLDIRNDDAGDPRLFLYEHGVGEITELATTVLPIGSWVHLEMRYRATPTDAGQVIVLQDGAVVFDTGLRATADDDHVSWSVGSWVSDQVTAASSFYIDDATLAADDL